jgi:hypothetical protein
LHVIERIVHQGRLVVLVGAIACARAIEFTGAPAPLLDRSFFAPTTDSRDTTIFEGQIATNLFLFDEMARKETRLADKSESDRQVAHRFLLVPVFRIRQLSDSSAAVRTPSFMPTLAWERHYLHAAWDTVPGSDSRDVKAIDDYGVRLAWTHHSNGQAGCFRDGYLPAPSGDPDDCTPGPTADPEGVTLNRASGDFSTTFWSATFFKRHVRLDDNQREQLVVEGSLGYQLHKFGLFGDSRPEQRELYGTHRLRVDFGARRTIGEWQLRLDTQAELAEDKDPRITPWRVYVDLTARWARLFGAGPMIRIMDGQDYYNIGFVQRRRRVLFAISVDPSGGERAR